jgi:hypothetical protein
MNYTVVLFKNKKRKRIIKKFITFSKAKTFYENLLSKSNDVTYLDSSQIKENMMINQIIKKE